MRSQTTEPDEVDTAVLLAYLIELAFRKWSGVKVLSQPAGSELALLHQMASSLLYAGAGYAVVTALALWLCWTRMVRRRRSPDHKTTLKPKANTAATQPTPQPATQQ